MRRLVKPIIFATALLFGSSALAQQSTPIRYNEGPGVKLSDSLVFHPGLAIETRYDSNVLNTNTNIIGAPYLRLIGHFDLATRSPQRRTDAATGKVARQKIEFRLQAAAGYREYLSGGDAVAAQRAVEVDAGFGLKFLPSRYFSFELSDTFGRAVTPQNGILIATPTSSSVISRDTNRAAATLRFIPGGGRLSFSLGYALNLDAFEEAGFSDQNRMFHEAFFRGKWRLLPKTALILDVIQQFYDYYNGTGGAKYVSSTPFRVYLGFSGLFTPKLSLLLKAGYGNGFYDSGDSFNSILAKAEIGYRFTPTAKFRLGYERSFSDSIFGNFYADHQAYIGYDHQIASRFLLRLSVDYRRRSYEGTAAFFNNSSLNTLGANVVTGSIGFDWQVRDWVYLGLGYDVQAQSYSETVNASGISGLVDFIRHQVFGKVGVSY